MQALKNFETLSGQLQIEISVVLLLVLMACSKPEAYFPAVKRSMLPNDALKGKIAFITGGGTGLGKAMALTFSALGAKVAIAAGEWMYWKKLPMRLRKKQEMVYANIVYAYCIIDAFFGKYILKVVPIRLNVKDSAEISEAADECQSKLGLPNIIVNNAAGNFISPTERLSPNAFKTIVDIVLMGTVYVTLEFGKRLIAANRGASFLAITTSYARHGSPFVTPSAASKAGVETFTKSMAAEWGKYGMRFNCIAPGSIYTEGAMSRLDPTGRAETEGLQSIPAGRLGETTELANLASYIVSDYGSWMSGSIVDFDGGAQTLSSGLFTKLHEVTPEQWDMLEMMIREKSGKSKI